MKNKHTLTNKKKFIDKIEQQLKDNMQKENEQIFSNTHDTLMDNLPGKSGETFQVELNENWLGYNEDSTRHIVDSKVYTKWWQKLLNWITFGLYKPITFWYKIKPVKK